MGVKIAELWYVKVTSGQRILHKGSIAVLSPLAVANKFVRT